MSSKQVWRIPFRTKDDASGRAFSSVQLTVRLEMPSHPEVGRYVTCIIDSGATFSVFQARFAKDLGLDLRAGEPVAVIGVGGQRVVWLHTIQLQLPGGPVSIRAGFQEDLPIGGLLGMSGFFEHFRVTFDGPAKVCELQRL